MPGSELETGLMGMRKQAEQTMDAVCVFKNQRKKNEQYWREGSHPLSKQADKKKICSSFHFSK